METNAPESMEHPIHLLLVEDEPDLRSALRYNLRRAGYRVSDAGNGQEALTLIDRVSSENPIDLVVSDVMMPVMDGIQFARAIRSRADMRETPLLFLTAKGEASDRLEGFRVGADDYMTKPFDLEELLARVQVQARRALMARKMRSLLEEPAQGAGAENSRSGHESVSRSDLYVKVAEWERRFPALAAIRRDSIVGQSPRMLSLLREILIRAPGTDPVLIVGETGSGKTGVAEALFQLGPRADKPFRVVNCAELAAADSAIPMGKLFGYGKGSGLPNVPKDGQPGLLEDLDGGTLFLDEIHRLPLEAQAMLLLPIEGRPFHPAVGKSDPRQVDVKFIFATNLDLQEEASADRFPFDLYQRLAQSQIHVPSLRERKEDVPALAEHFLEECREELDLADASFAPSLLRYILQRDWPGNVRELRAFVREIARRAAFELDTMLTLEHLPEGNPSLAPQPVTRTETTEAAPDADGPLSSPVSAAPARDDEVLPQEADTPSQVPGERNDYDGFWNESELEKLAALRRHRFKIAAAEQELGLSSKSRTLTNHLRGMCMKSAVHCEFRLEDAARMVVGRDDEALMDRTVDRLEGYFEMVRQHTAAHTTKLLFNNLPKDYRKFVETAIEHARAKGAMTPG